MATTQIMSERIPALGLEHRPVGGTTDEEDKAFFSQYAHLPPNDRVPHIMDGFFGGILPRKALPDLRRIAEDWKPDLIVREEIEYGGLILSELTGIPHSKVCITLGNRLENMADPIDRLRQEYGLMPDWGAAIDSAPTFTAFPASMEAALGTTDPRAKVRVWTAPETRPMETSDWRSGSGSPHLYMTFGTVVGSSDQAKRMFRAVLDAVAGMDAHVLMTTGAQMDLAALGAIPANVTLREFVPQNEVLPHVEAVLCHGGSGTVLGALSTALPLVVTPIAADQPDNAKAVAGIGAGIEVPEPDSAAIRTALTSVLSDPRFAARARDTAEEMKAHLGIGGAVQEMLSGVSQ